MSDSVLSYQVGCKAKVYAVYICSVPPQRSLYFRLDRMAKRGKVLIGMVPQPDCDALRAQPFLGVLGTALRPAPQAWIRIRLSCAASSAARIFIVALRSQDVYSVFRCLLSEAL
jgi:hypothetical protein